MNPEALKPAPKGALRRLVQRFEQYLFPPIVPPPISDERRKEILARLAKGTPADEGWGINSLLDFITIPINEMINFSYAKADEARAEEERIKNEKKSQRTPEPPSQSLGKLSEAVNKIKKDLPRW